MKRVPFLATGLACSLLLAAAGTTAHAQTQLMMGTGSVGGTYYPLGAAMSKVVNAKMKDVNLSIRTTGGSVENVRLMRKGEIELALLTAQTADLAYKGKAPFTEPVTELRAIGSIYPDVILVVARADRGITSFADLKGKKMNVGAIGAGTEIISREMLKLHGLEYPRDLTPIHLPYAQAADQLRDGHIDAVNFFLGVPAANLIDLTTLQRLTFVEFKGGERDKLLTMEPVIYAFTLPANTYKGQETPVETIAMPSSLFVHQKMSPDVVYRLTKTIYERADEILRTHVMGKWVDVKEAPKGITMPFHPGAERYLREKGVLK